MKAGLGNSNFLSFNINLCYCRKSFILARRGAQGAQQGQAELADDILEWAEREENVVGDR